jgi:hypothetical protein
MVNKFIIPSNLNLSKLLEQVPDFKDKDLDKLHYVINAIFYQKIIKQRSYDANGGCKNKPVKLCSKTLSRFLTSEKYKRILKTLEDLKVIKCVGEYSTYGKARSYGLCEPYASCSTFVQVPIQDRKLREKINHQNEDMFKQAVKDSLARQHIRKSIESLEFDDEAASKCVERRFPNHSGEKSYRLFIEDCYKSEFFFYSPVNPKKRGRFYHILTSTSKDLREFLTFKGKGLHSVDISNCQPTLLVSLYDDRERLSDEAKRYVQIVQNDEFYSFINERLEEPTNLSNKKQIKEKVYQYFFDYNFRNRYLEVANIFKREFPILFNKIRELKTKNHNKLALYLQNLEASIVIDDVIESLAKDFPDECFISIHDCIVTTQEFVKEVQKRLKNSFLTHLKLQTHIKTERVSKNKHQTKKEIKYVQET